MRAVFQRELPALAGAPIRVKSCRILPSRHRRGLRRRRTRLTYRVTVETKSGRRRHHLLVGTAPVSPDFLSPELLYRCRAAVGHPMAGSFRELATYLDGLEMAVVMLPVDPALPGLADVAGPEAAALLAPHLPECARGAVIESVHADVVHYRPCARCLLKLAARLREPSGEIVRRIVYVKVFADDRGGQHYANMMQVWPVACASTFLHVPQPLGYDEERRLLFMSEAPGERGLPRWLRRLETGRPLPAGVGVEELERCMHLAAGALGELQQSPIDHGEERSFRRELALLHRDADLVRRDRRELAAGLDPLLDGMGGMPVSEDQLVPAHGDFRQDQLIGNHRGLTVFNWHGLCLAPRGLDAATFLGRLRHTAVCSPQGGGATEHLAGVFRRAYLDRSPALPPGELAVFEALVLTRRALRMALRLRAPDAGLAGLLAAARRLLDGAGTVHPLL